MSRPHLPLHPLHHLTKQLVLEELYVVIALAAAGILMLHGLLLWIAMRCVSFRDYIHTYRHAQLYNRCKRVSQPQARWRIVRSALR